MQTEKAASRIKELLQGNEGAAGVRLGIKSRGCNGMSYTMNYAQGKGPGEEEVTDHGVKVFVDPKAIMHIVGTEMDFVEDEISSEFVFHNPNATGTCGCGESFTTKEQPGEALAA
mmetsp:Transcript_10033/g.29535  ORF Transcript_10033/g.29535 Transcript_10033/m.29535 type:complete len:115 (+) Transcript_10033:199-543(+)